MKRFHYESFLKHIQTHRITDFTTAPPVILMLSKRPETASYDLSSLREIVSGAAPLSKELQNDVMQRFNLNIRQTFGGTELTCSSHAVPGGVCDETGSVGSLYPNMHCKLLDEDGHEVAPGEPGEAYIRGPNIFLKYWQNTEATRGAKDKDDYYRTGDVCVRDKRGFYHVVDRLKELIKVNGLQVAPAELEAILLQHPAVADAAVVPFMKYVGSSPSPL
jgi:acyl-coenzyme A synthetase/AMP-(fatty) acid ligase